jgi:hypothetical protein
LWQTLKNEKEKSCAQNIKDVFATQQQKISGRENLKKTAKKYKDQ